VLRRLSRTGDLFQLDQEDLQRLFYLYHHYVPCCQYLGRHNIWRTVSAV